MSSKDLLRNYRHDAKLSKPYRTAHALDWASIHLKGQAIPYNNLLKAIEGYASMPRLNTLEVNRLRNSMTRVREILRVKYDRALVIVPGIGARATVDDEDQANNSVKPQTRRFIQVGEALKKRVDMMDISKIPKTKENQVTLAWLNDRIKPFMKQIDNGVLQKLLPPVDAAPAPTNNKKKTPADE